MFWSALLPREPNIKWKSNKMTSGGRLNIKSSSYQYRDSHVKDKTVSPTVLSLTWESPYLGKMVFILRRDPSYPRPFFLLRTIEIHLSILSRTSWHHMSEMPYKLLVLALTSPCAVTMASVQTPDFGITFWCILWRNIGQRHTLSQYISWEKSWYVWWINVHITGVCIDMTLNWFDGESVSKLNASLYNVRPDRKCQEYVYIKWEYWRTIQHQITNMKYARRCVSEIAMVVKSYEPVNPFSMLWSIPAVIKLIKWKCVCVAVYHIYGVVNGCRSPSTCVPGHRQPPCP